MTDDRSDDTDAARPADATQPAAEPTAAAPAAPAAETPGRRGVFIPVWAGVVVGVLVVFGLGFLIGWVAAPGGGDHGVRISRGVFPGGQLPFGGGARNGPFGGGTGNGPFGGGTGSGPFGGGGPGGPGRNANQAFLGVTTTDASSGQTGVPIANVESGSPADQAGLKSGDVITAVNGTNVANPQDLTTQIHSHKPGDQVTITYTRNGSSASASVKLGQGAGANVPSTLPAPPS